MDGDEGPSGDGIGKLSQRLSERAVVPGGEVDYKTKAGTAWSHSFLNQKPWHPLSYPNQRRKWIAEQTHANRERRGDEVAREFAQEQEFFRQTALFSKKEKEKVEMLKAVSFMYVRPPGYNAESAKAAEVADEKKRLDQNIAAEDGTNEATPAMPEVRLDSGTHRDKKARPKDVFGRALPTEEEFEVLKNAPRIDTGVAGRVKPFAVEIRNVRCVRCGAFGHQSGDRECPLKDAIMPNEESRLKRDDPLTAMMAQTDSSEPLKWELKQKPGMSPPRGGYQADDPNQQIVADDTIFDEYGGFLSGGDIPTLLANFTTSKPKKPSKHKSKHKDHHKSKVRHRNQSLSSEPEDDREMNRKHKGGRRKSRVRHRNQSSSSESEDESEMNLKHKDHHKSVVRHRNQSSSSESGDDREMNRRSRSKHKKKSSEFEDDREMNPRSRSKHKSSKSEDDVEMMNWRSRSKHKKNSESEYDMEINRRSRSKHRKKNHSSSSESGEKNQRSRSKHKRYHSSSSELEDDREKNQRSRSKHREQKKQRPVESSAPDSYDSYHHHHRRRRHSESIAPDSSDSHHHRHRREHGYHSDSTPYSSGSPHRPRRNQHR